MKLENKVLYPRNLKMAVKKEDLDINKTAIFSNFESIIGNSEVKRVQYEATFRLNEKLKAQVETLLESNKNLLEETKKLRKELKQEKAISNKKVDADVFFMQIAEVLKETKEGSEVVGNVIGWKGILEAVILEVEKCIHLVQNLNEETRKEVVK